MTGADAARAALGDWHDFFVIIGTGAASLIGAMFVVASIASGRLTYERAGNTSLFVTPTVVHLAGVLLGCALGVAAAGAGAAVGLLYGAGGLGGLAYAGRIAVHVGRREKIELIDRVWYGVVPALGYAIMLAAGVLFGRGAAAGADVLAAALAVLLISCIRNAWDMIIFLVIEQQQRGSS